MLEAPREGEQGLQQAARPTPTNRECLSSLEDAEVRPPWNPVGG